MPGARNIKGRTVSKSQVNIRFNLVDIFDRAYSDKPNEVKDQLRPLLKESLIKEAFAREVIFTIRERTKSQNTDVNNEQFAKYAQSYIKSKRFRNFSKSPSDINLTLSGSMLSSMEGDSSENSRVVTIGIGSGVNTLKAYNHITGDTVAERDFFGLLENQDEEILRKIINDASLNNLIVLGNQIASDVNVELQTNTEQTVGGNNGAQLFTIE